MKTKKPNTELVLKQVDELLVPRLRLSLTDRVVYLHLLSHPPGREAPAPFFDILACPGNSHGWWLCAHLVRRLVSKGALRLVERSRSGHVVEVPLPDEIRATTPTISRASRPHDRNLEETDFLQSKALRVVIHAREGGFRFYCLRQLTPRERCLDHVVPRARGGNNSYRNLVSACVECNSTKSETRAEDFLRTLYRKRRLTDAELNGRLRALDALAAGKLRPVIVSRAPASPSARNGRPSNPSFLDIVHPE